MCLYIYRPLRAVMTISFEAASHTQQTFLKPKGFIEALRASFGALPDVQESIRNLPALKILILKYSSIELIFFFLLWKLSCIRIARCLFPSTFLLIIIIFFFGLASQQTRLHTNTLRYSYLSDGGGGCIE